jgi:hypothetical protein
MLNFPPVVRIWLALAPADLRKGFDALAEFDYVDDIAEPLETSVNRPTCSLRSHAALTSGCDSSRPTSRRSGRPCSALGWTHAGPPRHFARTSR